MNTYTIYNKASGEIQRRVMCSPDQIEYQPNDGEAYIEKDSNAATQYVKGGVLNNRPSLQISVRKRTLIGVPIGAVIRIEQDAYKADGSNIDLSFAYPGSYLVEVECWPYQTWETTIENPA